MEPWNTPSGLTNGVRGIWEPAYNKSYSLTSTAEAVGVILSIDETVINPRSQDPGAVGAGGAGQMPMSNMMAGAMDTVNAQHGGSRSGNLGNHGVSYLKGRGGG